MTVDTTSAPKETWFGFVKDRTDALLLINACYNGTLQPITLPFNSMCLRIRSGSVVVTVQKNDNQNYCFRWRDNLHWTASKLTDNFMLYRQVLHVNQKVRPRQNSVNKQCRFHNGSLRSKSELIADGLAKRSWGTVAPDGFYYRVTHYFYPEHVEHYYNGGSRSESMPDLPRPSDVPIFDQYKPVAAEQFRLLDSKPPSPKQKDVQLPAETTFEPVLVKYNGTLVSPPPTEVQRRGSPPTKPSAKSAKIAPKRLQQSQQPLPIQHAARSHSIHNTQHTLQQNFDHYIHQHQHQSQLQQHHHSRSCGCGPLPSFLRNFNRFPRFDERSVVLPPLRISA
ncbi:UNVERIFIED_CONTAM: hypothetical protein HDU68_005436 [Siphonaria sp. JEL0065]|nr:hypothetical protein HDU68_005436 [Siphonaria sp. JEL0065]